MVELASFLPRVKNANVAVAEEGGNVIFLHKILPGGVDKSYGIHVAKLAGLPRSVVHRANELLVELETGSRQAIGKQRRLRDKEKMPSQLPLLAPKSPVLEELGKLDIDSLTPLEALTKLYELQKKLRES